MSSNGTGGLFLPMGTTMNGVRSDKMLEDKLKTLIAIYEYNIVMQDSASCHHSKLVSDFLKKKNIKTLDWLGNSSDLNPFENLCAIRVPLKYSG